MVRSHREQQAKLSLRSDMAQHQQAGPQMVASVARRLLLCAQARMWPDHWAGRFVPHWLTAAQVRDGVTTRNIQNNNS